MTAESLAQGIRERDDHQRQRGYGQNGVRNQKCEVHRPDPALASEADDARVHVKINVKAQKKDRAGERAQHGSAVPTNFSVANERQANKQKESTNSVQGCVDRWKGRERNNCHVRATLREGAV